MTIEELSKEMGRAPSTIQYAFKRLKNTLEKKGIIINKIGKNNYTLEYLENAEINTKNLTKYKFGKLQPLFRLEEKGNSNGIMWHCLCDCGNECNVAGGHLVSGHTKSCGCLTTAKDITNQKFGKLTALYPTEERRGTEIVWHCLCECGNEHNATIGNLIAGNVKSCGCLIKEKAKEMGKSTIKDITNQKFGKLTVMYPTTQREKNGSVIWHCKCECGNECDISSNNLISKRIDRCKKCSPSCKSQGELKISEILDKMKISYINEYKPFKFENNYYARYDFYVNNNYIIEFDGEQHFREVKIFKQSLQEVQEHDRIKNQWCRDNNIPLIRIPYTHLNDLCLEDLLLETTKWRVV